MLDTSGYSTRFSMLNCGCMRIYTEWRSIMGILKIVSVCVFAAVALGFFASIGIWAAVLFLRLFGIETL